MLMSTDKLPYSYNIISVIVCKMNKEENLKILFIKRNCSFPELLPVKYRLPNAQVEPLRQVISGGSHYSNKQRYL